MLFPIAFGDNHQKGDDPNDEPFLPIFPIYPYNPKLIKRGIDKETETQLTAELYAPKVDAKDTYTTNYNSNYQKDPYYPNYDPYSKSFSSSSTSYSPHYINNPQAATTATSASYSTLPYNVYNTYTNPYISATSHSTIPSTAYSASSYSTTAYPTSYSSNAYNGAPYQPTPYVPVSNYYYQQPYYYPSYYAPALFPPPPPPPLAPFPHPDYTKVSESGDKDGYEKDSKRGQKVLQKSKKDDKSLESSEDRYENGGNYISLSNSNDLDSQSSSYKVANSYNRLEQTDEPQEKLSESGTYKVVNIRTKPPSDMEYSIAATYAKTQQLELLMRQTLAKLLAENAARQIVRYPSYDDKQNQLIKANNEVSYGNLNNYDNNNQQNFVPLSNTIAKTGLSYVVNHNALENINSGTIVPRQVLQTPTALARTSKYSDDQYLRKPITIVSLQQSQGSYVPLNKSIKSSVSNQSSNYDGYENEDTRTNHNYDDSLDDTEGKQEDVYGQGQTSSGYKNQNFVTVQTPQAYSYQYASYNPQQTTNQQGIQEYEDNARDVEFGAKQSNKG